MSDDLTPPPARDMPDVERRRAHLVRELAAPAPRRRARRRWLALVPVLVVVTGAGYSIARPVTNYASVACHDGADPRVGATTIISTPDGDPVGACAAMWRTGAVGKGTAVPPLKACTAFGSVYVVPTRAASCGELGLGEPPEDWAERAPTESQRAAEQGERWEREHSGAGQEAP